MKKIVLLFFLLAAFPLHARIYIPIDQPSDKKLPIAITELVDKGGARKEAREIPAIIQNDLEISSYFQFIPSEAFLEPKNSEAITTREINFDLWTVIEAHSIGTFQISGLEYPVI